MLQIICLLHNRIRAGVLVGIRVHTRLPVGEEDNDLVAFHLLPSLIAGADGVFGFAAVLVDLQCHVEAVLRLGAAVSGNGLDALGNIRVHRTGRAVIRTDQCGCIMRVCYKCPSIRAIILWPAVIRAPIAAVGRRVIVLSLIGKIIYPFIETITVRGIVDS